MKTVRATEKNGVYTVYCIDELSIDAVATRQSAVDNRDKGLEAEYFKADAKFKKAVERNRPVNICADRHQKAKDAYHALLKSIQDYALKNPIYFPLRENEFEVNAGKLAEIETLVRGGVKVVVSDVGYFENIREVE